VRPGSEYISAWHIAREVQPGVFVHRDFDFEKPSVDLTTTKSLVRKYTLSNYEVYDYPGTYHEKPDGEHYAHVRIDEFGAQFEQAQALTNYRGISVGCCFELQGHDVSKDDSKYIVTGATQSLESSQYESGDGSSEFRCTFTALSTKQQFRPRRATPKPFVQGPQTAVVVGPAGDEIYTDKYGRVKVQFHWDRRGKKDENSSCWVRVSHPWAGKGWGAISTPRIGQEVIVDFLEGDPDQPIITGRVYNEENQPPFGFPAGAVISGVKSDTHKGSGFNEMSLDDTAGAERVFIHGQFNMDTVVEHDQTTTVHNCRTDVIDVDDSETVGGNQTLHVVKNQTANIDINRTETVGGNETITVQGHRSETVNSGEDVTVTGSRVHTVNGAQATTITLAENHAVGAARAHEVGGAELIAIGAAQTITVGAIQSITVGGSQKVKIGGPQTADIWAAQSVNVGAAASLKVGADQSITVEGSRVTQVGKDDGLKVTKNLVIDAGDAITIKTGDASISMKKNGTIQIKGKDITILGSGKINVKADKDILMKGSKIKQN
jgi:type VI secretion system secreted protein VgrG